MEKTYNYLFSLKKEDSVGTSTKEVAEMLKMLEVRDSFIFMINYVFLIRRIIE